MTAQVSRLVVLQNMGAKGHSSLSPLIPPVIKHAYFVLKIGFCCIKTAHKPQSRKERGTSSPQPCWSPACRCTGAPRLTGVRATENKPMSISPSMTKAPSYNGCCFPRHEAFTKLSMVPRWALQRVPGISSQGTDAE